MRRQVHRARGGGTNVVRRGAAYGKGSAPGGARAFLDWRRAAVRTAALRLPQLLMRSPLVSCVVVLDQPNW